jgi:hypothetical protein
MERALESAGGLVRLFLSGRGWAGALSLFFLGDGCSPAQSCRCFFLFYLPALRLWLCHLFEWNEMALSIGNCPIFLRVFACFSGLVKVDKQKMDALEKTFISAFVDWLLQGRDFGECGYLT